MKKQIFLTSSVNEVAHDIATHLDLNKGNKLAFIYTAAEPEESGKDSSWNNADRESLVKAGFDLFDYTITDKTKDQINDDLRNIDILYVSGGNTFYLLEKAQQSGFISLIKEYVEKQGKVYIGTSAGSIVAGPDIYPTHKIDYQEKAPNLRGYEGFGLVNFCIFPHWGSDFFKELYLDHRLEHAYNANQIPLVALTDNQYAYVKDDKVQFVTVSTPPSPPHLPA